MKRTWKWMLWPILVYNVSRSWTVLCEQTECGSINTWTIMYCKQTAEPRSAHFCIRFPVDKIRSSLNCHPSVQGAWYSISLWKIRIEYIDRFVRGYVANGVRRDKHGCCSRIGSRMWPFNWLICIWSLRILKVNVKIMNILTVNILKTITDRKALRLPTNRKSH